MKKKREGIFVSKSHIYYLWFVVVGMLFASTIFDVAVTYTVYKREPATFYDYEANKVFKWGVEHKIPLLLNPSILIHYVLIALFTWSTNRVLKHQKGFTNFILFLLGMLMVSVAHILGGYSWW